MATKKKLLEAAAGAAGGASLNVEDVFSTYLVTGTGSAYTVNNGIDLSGEGGLVWIKGRNLSGYNHTLYDTERSGTLFSDTTNAASDYASEIASYNNNGFTTVSSGAAFNNVNNTDYASWTFRKAPKFFDVVTYTGTGVARTVSHNLGSVPAMIIVKRTDSATSWNVYHRGLNGGTNPHQYGINLNTTGAEFASSGYWNNTAPTSTEFTVGTSGNANASGGTYVAYLFAHNNGDGEFGPDADQDIIKCGSFSAPTQTTFDINLGFEPSFFLVKKTSGTGDWYLIDTMRGFNSDANAGPQNKVLRANTSGAEGNEEYYRPTATGVQGWHLGSGDYIYIAIRRGPMAVPTAGTDVFGIDGLAGATSPDPWFTSNFVTDFTLVRRPSFTDNWIVGSRLTGTRIMYSDLTNAETVQSNQNWDYMNGVYDANSNISYLSWMWKRAPNYFDVVAYTGTGGASQSISHNLGVVPEMIWVKDRGNASNWSIYHSATGISEVLNFATNAPGTGSQYWGTNSHTSSVFKVGSDSDTGGSGKNYIAYLFATLNGVSKVGSYTGSNSDQDIDCGFTSGARFVLIKRYSSSGSWYVFDTERGIVVGADGTLTLDSSGAESSEDKVYPYSGGFGVKGNLGQTNQSGSDYIFYAIA